MIDCHTHILPAMDDGSEKVNVSLEMLRECKRQDIEALIATPHYYARRERPESFLLRRNCSLESIAEERKGQCLPKIILGAEVYWFTGMGHAEGLEELVIQDTTLMLVEMPYTKWNKQMIDELRILRERNISPVFAHINRYPAFCRRREIDELCDMGFYFQVNTETFHRFFDSRRALRMLDRGQFYMLGSDCHNMTERCPDLGYALDVIRDKRGEDAVEDLKGFVDELLY